MTRETRPESLRIALLVARFNSMVTEQMLEGARQRLLARGLASEEHRRPVRAGRLGSAPGGAQDCGLAEVRRDRRHRLCDPRRDRPLRLRSRTRQRRAGTGGPHRRHSGRVRRADHDTGEQAMLRANVYGTDKGGEFAESALAMLSLYASHPERPGALEPPARAAETEGTAAGHGPGSCRCTTAGSRRVKAVRCRRRWRSRWGADGGPGQSALPGAAGQRIRGGPRPDRGHDCRLHGQLAARSPECHGPRHPASGRHRDPVPRGPAREGGDPGSGAPGGEVRRGPTRRASSTASSMRCTAPSDPTNPIRPDRAHPRTAEDPGRQLAGSRESAGLAAPRSMFTRYSRDCRREGTK